MYAPEGIILTNRHVRAIISPIGAELRSLRTGAGPELIWQGAAGFWPGRAPLLFPVIGRWREDELPFRSSSMGIHGFASTARFQVVSGTDDSCILELAHPAQSDVYPFACTLRVEYRLWGDRLDVAMRIHNGGPTPIWAAAGLHPGFNIPRVAACRLIFSSDERSFRRMAEGRVLGAAHLGLTQQGLQLRDELFAAGGLLIPHAASHEVSIVANGALVASVSRGSFEHLALWSQPGARFICVEPWSGLPPGGGLKGTEPIPTIGVGETLMRNATIRVSITE